MAFRVGHVRTGLSRSLSVDQPNRRSSRAPRERSRLYAQIDPEALKILSRPWRPSFTLALTRESIMPEQEDGAGRLLRLTGFSSPWQTDRAEISARWTGGVFLSLEQRVQRSLLTDVRSEHAKLGKRWSFGGLSLHTQTGLTRWPRTGARMLEVQTGFNLKGMGAFGVDGAVQLRQRDDAGGRHHAMITRMAMNIDPIADRKFAKDRVGIDPIARLTGARPPRFSFGARTRHGATVAGAGLKRHTAEADFRVRWRF